MPLTKRGWRGVRWAEVRWGELWVALRWAGERGENCCVLCGKVRANLRRKLNAMLCVPKQGAGGSSRTNYVFKSSSSNNNNYKYYNTHTQGRTFVTGWCPIKVAKFCRFLYVFIFSFVFALIGLNFACTQVAFVHAAAAAAAVIVVYRLSIAGNNNYCNAMEIVLLSNRHTHIHTHTIAWHYVALFFCFDEFWQQQQLLQPQQ